MMQRRSFLSRISAAAAFVGIGQAPADAQAPGPYTAARHQQDDWFDQAAKHRVLFDTWSAEKFAEALLFAGNYFRANTNEYGLAAKDLTVVLVARHRTTPFAFNDAMWAKYGKAFSARMEWTDPNTHQPPTTNLFATQLTNLGKQGLKLAVCNMTTRAYTSIIAREAGRATDEVYKELTANTIVADSHFVPAGVVAVTRAQEHGYALVAPD